MFASCLELNHNNKISTSPDSSDSRVAEHVCANDLSRVATRPCLNNCAKLTPLFNLFGVQHRDKT